MQARAPAPVPPYSPYGLPPPPHPFPAPPGYPPPAYPAAPGYPPLGYPGAPAFLVPAVWVPVCTVLAKQTTNTRWAAAIVDLAAVLGVWSLLFFSVYPALFPLSSFFFLPRFLITVSWFYLYYALLDGFGGGTPGKRLVGLGLVDKQLKPIRPTQAFARACEVFIWPFSVVIIFIIQLVLIEKDGRSIGDRMGGTYLVPRKSLQAAAGAVPA